MLSKHRETKNPPQNPQSSFCVDHLLLIDHMRSLRMVCVPCESIGENYFFFVSSYQLAITFRLEGAGLCPLSTLGPYLGQPCTGPLQASRVSGNSYMDWSFCVQKFLFVVLHTLWLLIGCLSSPQSSPSPEKRDLMQTSHLGLSASRSLAQCGCEFLYLFQPIAEGSFSSDG